MQVASIQLPAAEIDVEIRGVPESYGLDKKRGVSAHAEQSFQQGRVQNSLEAASSYWQGNNDFDAAVGRADLDPAGHCVSGRVLDYQGLDETACRDRDRCVGRDVEG